MKSDDVLTTEQLLDYLQVNLRTIYRLIKAGKIPAMRVGDRFYFRKQDVDSWLSGIGRSFVVSVELEEHELVAAAPTSEPSLPAADPSFLVAERWLLMLLPIERHDEILGDFEERFARARQRHGYTYAWYFLVRHTIGITVSQWRKRKTDRPVKVVDRGPYGDLVAMSEPLVRWMTFIVGLSLFVRWMLQLHI